MLRLHLAQSCALSIGVALLLSVSTVCLAQESRGSITGKVVDPQNAVVPGAAVVVTNTATNVSGHATTNQTGYFEVGFLLPGSYSVSVESSGFKKFVQTGITLDTGDRLALNLQLEIGQTSQSVEVSADAPLLDTATSAQGRVLNTRDIGQLPYTTMNPFALQAMAAGMIFTGAMTPDNNRALDHAATASYASGGLAPPSTSSCSTATRLPGPTADAPALCPTPKPSTRCASKPIPTMPPWATPWASLSAPR